MRTTDARRPLPRFERWTAVRNPAGFWEIWDKDGRNPLRHVDPLVRLDAVHLAAAAPELREMVKELARYFGGRYCDGYGYADKLIAAAWVVVVESKPLYSEVLRVSEVGMQVALELDYDQESEAA